MSKFRFLFAFFFLMLLLSCTKEEVIVTSPSTDAQKVIKEVEARIAEVEEQLQQEELEVEIRTPPVILNENSGYGFAEAIDLAGPNGRVIVESGHYYEPASVVIDHRVTIQAESGAVLHVDVSGPGLLQDPAIHILNANRVRISGLDIRPLNAPGNTGILVENSPRARINNNRITGFGLGLWLYRADQSRILDNQLTGIGGGVWGLVVQRGQHVIVRGNEVSDYSLGIFLSDHGGVAFQNEAHNNAGSGIFLCTAQFNTLPDGTAPELPDAANQWVITQNNSYDNGTGYTAQDGAFENLIVQNESSNNVLYDIALRGEIEDGIIFPTSRDNQVVTVGQYNDLIVKDCGENNIVIGGNMVDTTVDLCP